MVELISIEKINLVHSRGREPNQLEIEELVIAARAAHELKAENDDHEGQLRHILDLLGGDTEKLHSTYGKVAELKEENDSLREQLTSKEMMYELANKTRDECLVKINELMGQLRAARAEERRLDFVLNASAFLSITETDAGGKAYQLLTQDEDENYVVLSGEGSYFSNPRKAIDSALGDAEPQKGCQDNRDGE